MSGKTNPNTPNPTTPAPDSGTPAGNNAETLPGAAPTETPQAPPPAQTPPPLHEHPDFKARMEQAQRSARREQLAALGYQNLDTIEGLAAAEQALAADIQYAREQRQAAMTAEERLNEQIATLTSERDSLRTERDRYKQDAETAQQALAAFKADLQRESALVSAAQAAGAARPADVVMWARTFRPSEFSQIVGEGQTVSPEAVQALVHACADDRPEWFAARTPGSPSHGGARPPAAPTEKYQQQRQLARENARLR